MHAHPIFSRRSTVVATSIALRRRRSSFVTISTSSCSSLSMTRMNPGRCSIAELPETVSDTTRPGVTVKPVASAGEEARLERMAAEAVRVQIGQPHLEISATYQVVQRFHRLGGHQCYKGVPRMALPMTRPTKHPKTGVYLIRIAIPADLVLDVGRPSNHARRRPPEPANLEVPRKRSPWPGHYRFRVVDSPPIRPRPFQSSSSSLQSSSSQKSGGQHLQQAQPCPLPPRPSLHSSQHSQIV
jgi:hypothetical protein